MQDKIPAAVLDVFYPVIERNCHRTNKFKKKYHVINGIVIFVAYGGKNRFSLTVKSLIN